MRLLHIGAGKKWYPGMENLTEADLDISKMWPYESDSIDGVISMQVLQQLYWRDLMFAIREAYRVLRPGGVFRNGTMLVDHNQPEYMLGWDNINLFSYDLLKQVFEQVGFRDVRIAEYQDCFIQEFKQVDDRPVGLGTSYIECRK